MRYNPSHPASKTQMTSASALFIVAPCYTLADKAVFFIIMLCHLIIEGCVGVKSLNTFFIEEMLQGIHTPGADALAHQFSFIISRFHIKLTEQNPAFAVCILQKRFFISIRIHPEKVRCGEAN